MSLKNEFKNEFGDTVQLASGKANFTQLYDVYIYNDDIEILKKVNDILKKHINIWKGFTDEELKNKIKDHKDSLDKYKDEIIAMEGFGEKSYNNLIQAIEKARSISVARFVYSLGIANIGLSNAKLLCRYFKDNINLLMAAEAEEMTTIEGIGPIIAKSVETFFKNEKQRAEVEQLIKEVNLEKEILNTDAQIFQGKTFVITGTLDSMDRNEAKAKLLSLGAKVAIAGSACVKIIQDNLDNVPVMLEKLESYIRSMKEATKA